MDEKVLSQRLQPWADPPLAEVSLGLKLKIIKQLMVFRDRKQAGELLGEKLEHLRGEKLLVLGIPRGGVVVGKEVAEKLGAELGVVVTKKLSAPGHEELAIGAIAEDGQPIWDERLLSQLGVGEEYKVSEVKRKRETVRSYIKEFRGGRDLEFGGKTVVLVDDGIATGQTMEAAIEWLSSKCKLKSSKLIVAVPTCARDSLERLKVKVDEFVCLDTPAWFGAVGQFYEDFAQVEDGEVKEILSNQQTADSRQ